MVNILVVESYPTYADSVFYRKDIHFYHLSCHDSALQTGLPSPSIQKANHGKTVDHGRLVLSCLAGKNGLTETGEEGTAPQEANIVYAYTEKTFQKPDFTQDIFSLFTKQLLDKTKRNDLLKKCLYGTTKIDVVSLSDSTDILLNTDDMKYHLIDNCLGAISYMCEQSTPEEKLKSTGNQPTPTEKMFDEMGEVFKKYTGNTEEIVKSRSFQKTLREVRQKYFEYVRNNIKSFPEDRIKTQFVLKGFDALIIPLNETELPILKNHSPVDFKVLQQQLMQRANEYDYLKQQIQKEGIAFMSVDLPKDYRINVRGFNKNGDIYEKNENARNPDQLPPERTVLFLNEFVKSNGTKGQGGISLLIPKLAGLVAAAKEANSNLTPQEIFELILLTGEMKKTTSGKGGVIPDKEKLLKACQEKEMIEKAQEAAVQNATVTSTSPSQSGFRENPEKASCSVFRTNTVSRE